MPSSQLLYSAFIHATSLLSLLCIWRIVAWLIVSADPMARRRRTCVLHQITTRWTLPTRSASYKHVAWLYVCSPCLICLSAILLLFNPIGLNKHGLSPCS